MVSTRKTSISILISAVAILVSSCNSSEGDGIPVQAKDKKNKIANDKALKSTFDNAISIDSTTVVMYPMKLGVSEKAEERPESYSSRSENGPYWNIAFYDTKAGTSNLLDSAEPIRINSFQTLKDIIIYNITTSDHNADGKLDHKDPSYLFTSNFMGKEFKQITPNDVNVNSFTIVKDTQILLIQTVTDSNGDKKFSGDDEITPMIFDKNKADVAKATFSPSFKAEVEKVFKRLYKD